MDGLDLLQVVLELLAAHEELELEHHAALLELVDVHTELVAVNLSFAFLILHLLDCLDDLSLDTIEELECLCLESQYLPHKS